LLGNIRRAKVLLPLLEDEDVSVRREAVAALRALSGKDFGFDPAKPGAGQGEIIARWRKWCDSR
jgi:HEAT repeat protein